MLLSMVFLFCNSAKSLIVLLLFTIPSCIPTLVVGIFDVVGCRGGVVKAQTHAPSVALSYNVGGRQRLGLNDRRFYLESFAPTRHRYYHSTSTRSKPQGGYI